MGRCRKKPGDKRRGLAGRGKTKQAFPIRNEAQMQFLFPVGENEKRGKARMKTPAWDRCSDGDRIQRRKANSKREGRGTGRI